MDYYKYIKYKTKYLNLKYDNNQYGGGVVPCDKGYTNMLGTCWAVSILMIFCFGHLTSDQLYTVMNTFKNNTVSLEEIKINIELFIKDKIGGIQGNTELTNAFAHYDIFSDDKIDFLKEILRKFIERYYNKVMDIPFIIKPLKYMLAPKDNPERCELKIAENYKNLFDTSHVSKKINLGGFMYDDYLFCNLLSIFFLDYKVSFTNYYTNFSSIKFNPVTDLGILIIIHGHACCLFICNGEEKFYNDNDKKIYNCNWIKLLENSTSTDNLYIEKDGCLKFISGKPNALEKDTLFEVRYLTVISKHITDSNLDIDIKRILQFKDLGEIKDPCLQHILAFVYYEKHQFKEAIKMYESHADHVNFFGAYAQYRLGYMYYSGKGVDEDFVTAKHMFNLAAEQGNENAQYWLGYMYYSGEGAVQDYVTAEHMFDLAAKQGHAKAQYMLGYMYYYGEGVDQDYDVGEYMFTLAADQGNTDALNELVNILSNRYEMYVESGIEQSWDNVKIYFNVAAKQGNTDAQYMLGYMYYNENELFDDKELFDTCMKQYTANAQYILGYMYYEGKGVTQDYDKAREMFNLAAGKSNT